MATKDDKGGQKFSGEHPDEEEVPVEPNPPQEPSDYDDEYNS